MRTIVALSLMLQGCITAHTPPVNNKITATEAIPVEFQHNRSVKIVEMTQDQIDKQCGKGGIDATGTVLVTIACGDINGNVIYMPNPCLDPSVSDFKSYAHLLCHEIAHTEGWKHRE